RFFITGAQGFVGRYLICRILELDNDAHVLGIGRSAGQNHSFTHSIHWGTQTLPAPLPAELKNVDSGRYEYLVLDVHQREQVRTVLDDFRPNFIVHLASGLRDDPLASLLTTNLEGT